MLRAFQQFGLFMRAWDQVQKKRPVNNAGASERNENLGRRLEFNTRGRRCFGQPVGHWTRGFEKRQLFNIVNFSDQRCDLKTPGCLRQGRRIRTSSAGHRRRLTWSFRRPDAPLRRTNDKINNESIKHWRLWRGRDHFRL
jgi:hypothetical protein